MLRTVFLSLGLMIPTLLAYAEEPTPAECLARTPWAVSEVILENHIDPPARQEMLLAAIKELYFRTQKQPPHDLARRVSRVTSEAELAKLVTDLGLTAMADNKEKAERISTFLGAGALRGVREGASYTPMEMYRVTQQTSNNRYEGTGVQVRMHEKEKLVQVMAAFPNGPARRAGMKADDLIEAIDGIDCKGKSLQEVVNRLRGEVGAPVTVLVRQPGSEEKRTIKIVRDVVPFETVTGFRRIGEMDWDYRVDPKSSVGYLRVRTLTSSVAAELRKAEAKLREAGCRALVLDMRGTHGDEVRHAALLADALLDGSTLWHIRDLKGKKEYKADRDCLFRDWPMAVLIGQTTGGNLFGDLVAAALQDAKRATLVGEETTGDGLVRAYVQGPENLGMVRIPVGIIERADRERARKETEEHVIGTRHPWVVRPDRRVPLDRVHTSTLMQWHEDQLIPEKAAKSGTSPQDPQLTAAMAVLEAKVSGTKDAKPTGSGS